MEPGLMRRRRAVAAALAAMSLAAACRVETHEPRQGAGAASVLAVAADSAAIMQELVAYYRDFSARAWTAFADHFWPGADISTIWQPPGEGGARVVITSIPEFVQRAPDGPGSREIFEERMIDARLTLFRHQAQAWVRYHARFGDSGAVQEWEGIDAFTLLRHAGRWRIVGLVFLSDDAGS
jgi:hypothetical protein